MGDELAMGDNVYVSLGMDPADEVGDEQQIHLGDWVIAELLN